MNDERREALNDISDSLWEIFVKLVKLQKEEQEDEDKDCTLFFNSELDKASYDLLVASNKVDCARMSIQEALKK